MPDYRPKLLKEMCTRNGCERESSGSDEDRTAIPDQQVVRSEFVCVTREADENSAEADRGLSFGIGELLEGVYPTNPWIHESAAENAPFGQALSNVGSMSVGSTAERIVGLVDDRTQVNDTSPYPYCSICLIEWTGGGKSYMGTGWLISPNVVITAGHCICDDYGRLFNPGTYRVYRAPSRPEQVTNGTRVLRSFCTQEYQRNPTNSPAYDFGALILQSDLINADMRLVPKVMNPNQLTNALVNLVGYTQPTGPRAGGYPRGTMWRDANRITRVRNVARGVDQIDYLADTMRGTSGAPVILVENGEGFVIGIHNHGGPETRQGEWYANYNTATLITSRVNSQLEEWQAQGRVR